MPDALTLRMKISHPPNASAVFVSLPIVVEIIHAAVNNFATMFGKAFDCLGNLLCISGKDPDITALAATSSAARRYRCRCR